MRHRTDLMARQEAAYAMALAGEGGGGGAYIVFLRPEGAGQDDGPSIVGAMIKASSRGVPLFMLGGTYEVLSKFTTPSNVNVEIFDAIINQQLTPGVGAFFSNCFLYATLTLRGTPDGTLHTTPNSTTAPATQLVVDLLDRPVAGNLLRLEATGASKGGVAAYKIKNVTGASSPWTCDIDRPVVWPFQAGDIVQELASVPENITIDGHNAIGGGTGDEQVEIAYARNFELRKLHYDATLGLGIITGVAPLALDVGTISSLVEDCHYDLTGGPAGTLAGPQMQSNERGTFRRLHVRGSPGAGIGSICLFDNFSSGAEDCWVYEGNPAGWGFQVDSLDVTKFPGNNSVWICGGGAVRTGYGMYIQGNSKNTKVSDWSADGCVIAGINVSVATKTKLDRVDCTYCGVSGIILQAQASDVFMTDIDCSHALGGAGHGIAGALDIGCAGITKIDGCTIDLDVGEADYATWIRAGSTAEVSGLRINTAASYGAYVNGGTLNLSDSKITNTSTSGFEPCIYMDGGICELQRVVFVSGNPGGQGVYLAGGTIRIGAGCDLSSCTTPITIAGGTCIVEQAGELPLTMAGGVQTVSWTTASSLILSGTNGTINLPAIPGMQWTVVNGGSGNATVQPIGGTPIVVASGKTAILRITDAGNMAQVTAVF